MVNAVDGDPTTKATWRANIVAARRAVSPEQRATEAEALRAHLLSVARAGTTVCAYVPSARSRAELTCWMRWFAAGVRVLLPVAREEAGSPQPLPWGEYRAGGLVAAPFGLARTRRAVAASGGDRRGGHRGGPCAGRRPQRGAAWSRRRLLRPVACRWPIRRPGWSRWSVTRSSSTNCPPRTTTFR